jgi:cell division transport system permease protein
MMPLKVDYVARETATNLRRNLLMTSAAVLTVAISLALVGGALLLRQGVSNAAFKWRGGVEISVFMNTTAAPGETEAVRRNLDQAPEVKRFFYVDQKEAYEEFKKIFASTPDMIEATTAEDLPPSFRVIPQDAEQVDLIGARFEKQPGVFRVSYAKEEVKDLLSITRIMQVIILAVAGLLLLAAVILVLNTIRMAIFARRREVAVMKLVGATNWFIRVPFMFEGLLQGVLGAGTAFAVVYLGRNVAQSRLRDFPLFTSFFVSGGEVMTTGIFLLVGGALLGAVGSAIAVTRFLDV